MGLKTYIKLHSGCRHLHAPIDATVQIVNQYGLALEDIEKVTVRIYSVAIEVEINNPKTVDEARFNIPFGVSLGLVYGDALVERFTEEIFHSQQIRELMKKVTVEISFRPRISASCPFESRLNTSM